MNKCSIDDLPQSSTATACEVLKRAGHVAAAEFLAHAAVDAALICKVRELVEREQRKLGEHVSAGVLRIAALLAPYEPASSLTPTGLPCSRLARTPAPQPPRPAALMSEAMGSPSRTRLSPVYLTAAERHLVRSALDVLISEIQRPSDPVNASTSFARVHTVESIEETAALFHDKAAPATTEGTP